MESEKVPRMRTAPRVVAEIRALDPESEVTEYFIRQLVRDGTVKAVWAGNKALIDLNDVLDLLRIGTDRKPPEHPMSGIRRVDVRRSL